MFPEKKQRMPKGCTCMYNTSKPCKGLSAFRITNKCKGNHATNWYNFPGFVFSVETLDCCACASMLSPFCDQVAKFISWSV